jgi:OHCU decarboxylase
MNGIERLNKAPSKEAESDLLSCCGSRAWVRQMIEARPFNNFADLLKKAEAIWWSLTVQDWLEAFSSHLKIGERKAERTQSAQASQWSEEEQAGMRHTLNETQDALTEANRIYEEKFGHIFIVCATGKSSEEMLSLCRKRSSNDAKTELRIAAEEQRKITEIRLKKLLGAIE